MYSGIVNVYVGTNLSYSCAPYMSFCQSVTLMSSALHTCLVVFFVSVCQYTCLSVIFIRKMSSMSCVFFCVRISCSQLCVRVSVFHISAYYTSLSYISTTVCRSTCMSIFMLMYRCLSVIRALSCLCPFV